MMVVLLDAYDPRQVLVRQAERRATWAGEAAGRMWDYLTHGDCENR